MLQRIFTFFILLSSVLPAGALPAKGSPTPSLEGLNIIQPLGDTPTEVLYFCLLQCQLKPCTLIAQITPIF
jgi:hypothetical protein